MRGRCRLQRSGRTCGPFGVAGDGKTGDTAAIQRQSTGAGACSPIPKLKQETGPLSEQAG
jgi:hypothetical protein